MAGLFLLFGGLPLISYGGVNLAPETLGLDPFETRTYIVQLAEPPALTYRGQFGGVGATRPARGQRFDPKSSNVRQYTRKLTDRHDHLLQSVGAYADKLYSYRYAFNGFAARLTAIQAQKLRSNDGVLRVWEDQIRYLYTNDSPTFLGLFDASGGLITDRKLKGEDIVIGVIDSGIAPEHPSFSDSRAASRPKLCQSSWAEESLLGLWLCRRFSSDDDVLLYDPPVGWNGRCEAGENFETDACNNKIIGARFYFDGFSENHTLDDGDFISPRDADGHGTHIASTAAGNEVSASLAGSAIDRINGIAPRARIAVYKACWLEPGQLRGTCSTSDLQRAIEDAVADGVDIINYSVGNTDVSLSDPDDLALLAAANAGVLPVVAAGNDGPHPLGYILSPAGAPWVLTVGASSRTGEKFEEALQVNAPVSIGGLYAAREAGFTTALKTSGPITEELILTDDGTGESTFDACDPLANGAEVSGKIAFLQRGLCDFEDKLKHAQEAGAIAAVVMNNQEDLIIMSGTAGSVTIPAVMIGQADGQLLLDRIEGGQSVELTLDKGLFLNIAESGSVMAGFSSSGPNNTNPDILKPDVTAPGVNILAGQSPDLANGIQGENFQYLSGTSMAVPHVAGIAALIRQAHPDWSPAAIKSALMTSARQDVVKKDAVTPAGAFDMGSGHVVPNSSVDPGLVYEAGREDYDAFTCGTSTPRVTDDECRQLAAAGFPTAAVDLNLPTIALSTLVSSRTVRRRVTNVGEPAQYRVEVDAPTGIDVDVNPAVLSLAAGETASYAATFTASGAELTEWSFGALSWVDGSHIVRSPFAMRPVQFFAPLDVASSGTSGSLNFDVEFGYTGSYETSFIGFAAPYISPTPETVSNDPLQLYEYEPNTDLLPGSVWRSVPPLIVDEGDIFLRIALFNEHTDGDDDLDLYVYHCDEDGCLPVGIGGNFDSDEQIDILYPEAGEYYIDVHGFNTDQVVGGPGAEFKLFIWTVGPGDTLGDVTFMPPSAAVTGETANVSLSWDTIDHETHVGAITHGDGANLSEITIVTIEN